MKITPIGIDIDENIIDVFYKIPQDRKLAKICKETNFSIGHISYEDGVFLPHGTYILVKENGKEDVLGRIFHFKKDKFNDMSIYGTAIVNINYDMNSSNERLKMDDSLILGFIHKNHLLNKHNKEKYLQVVSCDMTDDNIKNEQWKFVKVEYGNPDTKMFYMYGWRHYNGFVYEKKDITSNKLSCFETIHKSYFIYDEQYDCSKHTNVEYKIKSFVLFVPNEIEYLIIYIFLLCITFIFKERLVFWIIFTIWFLIKRKKLRNEYNG